MSRRGGRRQGPGAAFVPSCVAVPDCSCVQQWQQRGCGQQLGWQRGADRTQRACSCPATGARAAQAHPAAAPSSVQALLRSVPASPTFFSSLPHFTPSLPTSPWQIRELLTQIQERFNWQPIMEGGNIIGLTQAGQSVTLEPGGQFELSGATLDTLHKTCAEVNGHLYQVGAGALLVAKRACAAAQCQGPLRWRGG